KRQKMSKGDLKSGDRELVVFPLGEGRDGAFADIIIPLALPKTFTWSVPPLLLDNIKAGCRVEVNLGKNKKYAGVVKRLHNEKPEFFEPKEILNLLDTEPVVFGQQLQLWEWMASYYM
ncbi:MAG: primosomal protein N' family DNA-binding protein, partial [Chitinophagaceae bacterium]